MITKPTYDTPLKGYISEIEHEDACVALKNNTDLFISMLHKLPEEQWFFRYAEGKWSVKEMVQHINDTERIFGYRLIRLLRKDATPLPGYDENHFATHGLADHYSGEELLTEFKLIRSLTQWTLDHCNNDALDFVGQANGNPVTARAIAFAMVGHVQHHLQILKDRYALQE